LAKSPYGTVDNHSTLECRIGSVSCAYLYPSSGSRAGCEIPNAMSALISKQAQICPSTLGACLSTLADNVLTSDEEPGDDAVKVARYARCGVDQEQGVTGSKSSGAIVLPIAPESFIQEVVLGKSATTYLHKSVSRGAAELKIPCGRQEEPLGSRGCLSDRRTVLNLPPAH
jgi:hypothetical protein